MTDKSDQSVGATRRKVLLGMTAGLASAAGCLGDPLSVEADEEPKQKWEIEPQNLEESEYVKSIEHEYTASIFDYIIISVTLNELQPHPEELRYRKESGELLEDETDEVELGELLIRASLPKSEGVYDILLVNEGEILDKLTVELRKND